MSHPAWVCGLKLPCFWQIAIPGTVTPCVGVWIETAIERLALVTEKSHPAWVCGLKLARSFSRNKNGSHTLRGCVD